MPQPQLHSRADVMILVADVRIIVVMIMIMTMIILTMMTARYTLARARAASHTRARTHTHTEGEANTYKQTNKHTKAGSSPRIGEEADDGTPHAGKHRASASVCEASQVQEHAQMRDRAERRRQNLCGNARSEPHDVHRASYSRAHARSTGNMRST
eukprot:3625840-Rhodomonas_salina.4